MKKILTGDEAKAVLDKLLDGDFESTTENCKFPEPYIAGYYKHEEKRCYEHEERREWQIFYIAFDNRSGDCWVEEISTEKRARDWCEGKLDTQSLHIDERLVEMKIENEKI